jgi:hypothetical protein
MLKDIAKGKKIKLNPLRKGDKFTDIYNEIVKVAEKYDCIDKK